MTDVGWYSSPIRQGVYDYIKKDATEEFLEWSGCVLGTWEFHQKGSMRMIQFSRQEDQVAYLLRWTEDVTFDHTILNLIRRVMPSVIANDIIGVQPMTGPVGQLFAMRARYLLNLTDDQDDPP
jgi:hypothetical protein